MPPKAKKPITVIERRLKSGSIFTAGTRPIPLKEPDRWTLRMVNAEIADDRLYQMQAEKGWTYATEDDLAVKADEVGLKVEDGRIRRGRHEVLMKMERADYAAIVKAKDAENRRITFSKTALKQAVVAETGTEHGDQAADYISRNVAVTDSLERVPLDEA